MVLERYTRHARRIFDSFAFLDNNTFEVRDIHHLKIAMGWDSEPLLEGEHLYRYEYIEDLNGRRLRDAEVLGAACCNGNPKILLEIGTSLGRTTALMARNAPNGLVYTVNIPPEEIADGGVNVTFAPTHEEIGKYYREQGITNVKQILANTKHWQPDFGPIDVAFIDGCHDAQFVYNDTRKILERCHTGSLILWHDFNPGLVRHYTWIQDVCRGIEKLYRDGILKGPIFHLQDSWVGLFQVP